MAENVTVVPAPSPVAQKRAGTSYRAFVIGALLLPALAAVLFYAGLRQSGAETKYRQAVLTQTQVFDRIAQAFRDAPDGETFAVAAANLEVAEAALAKLSALPAPESAEEFHRLLLETYRAYTGALRLMAEADDNPMGALVTANLMLEKIAAYTEGLDRLDFGNLVVRP